MRWSRKEIRSFFFRSVLLKWFLFSFLFLIEVSFAFIPSVSVRETKRFEPINVHHFVDSNISSFSSNSVSSNRVSVSNKVEEKKPDNFHLMFCVFVLKIVLFYCLVSFFWFIFINTNRKFRFFKWKIKTEKNGTHTHTWYHTLYKTPIAVS